MIISFNSWILICIFLFLIKYLLIKPSEDSKMYKVYKVRDEVAIETLKGEISQQSLEYEYVTNVINSCLYYMCNNFNFINIYNNIIHPSEEKSEFFDNLVDKIYENNILHNSLNTSSIYLYKVLKLRLKVFYWFLFNPFFYFLKIIIKILDFTDLAINSNIRFNELCNNTFSIKEDYQPFLNKKFI